MRNFLPEPERIEVIAFFGEVTFLRGADGRCELRGGSGADRDAAEGWIARYFADQIEACLRNRREPAPSSGRGE